MALGHIIYKGEVYMGSLFITTHVDGNASTFTVTDMLTGDTETINNSGSDYEKNKEILKKMISEGATLEDIRNYLDGYYESIPEKKLEKIREELNIKILADDTVELPNGVILPAGIASIFKDIVDKEQAQSLIKFAELLMKNPREHAREALVQWIMKNQSLRIMEDGRIRGYRGLRNDMRSIHSGYAIVNGEEVNGHVDNTPGNIIEFPIHMIDHNPSRPCSVGLHIGTKKYALGYGERYVIAAFSPEDVVSPPSDASQSKIRVSKMEILEEFFD